jgi:hypothetical protein
MALALSLQPLVDSAIAAGVPTATDPGDVNTPGGWVVLEQLQPVTLGGEWRLECALYLIVGERDHRRALEQLSAMLVDLLAAGVRPDGPVTSQGVVLPGDPHPMPALRVPVHLFESE